MGCYFGSKISRAIHLVLTILVWFGMLVGYLAVVVVLSLLSLLMMVIFFC